MWGVMWEARKVSRTVWQWGGSMGVTLEGGWVDGKVAQ